MTARPQQPRIFVGSSVEGLDVARAIQDNLEFDAEVTIWPQGVFRTGQNALTSLMQALETFDFAVFVFSPDDILELRGERVSVARDNVIFELGLFLGRLGVDRCFHVVPRGSGRTLHLPSDLVGVQPLEYKSDRSDKQLFAALGYASNRIRERMREVTRRQSTHAPGASRHALKMAGFEDYRRVWNSEPLTSARADVRSIPSDPRDPEFTRKRASVEAIFVFLESLSDAVLSGEVVDDLARAEFGSALLSFWPFVATSLLPVGQVDAEEWWQPLPQMAGLYSRWKKAAEADG